jgi:hypothetical protein
MKRTGLRWIAFAVSTLLLSACGMENNYYVKTDNSPDVLVGVAHMVPPPHPPAPLDVGVTFKSSGKILPLASDTLYQTVHDGLSSKGRWDVHRIGQPGDDVAGQIRAIITAAAGSLPTVTGKARLLMLVENSPDLSGSTKKDYFLSGMTFGTYSMTKPTDRYDVTIAYRDAQGLERIYRSHQDLYFAVGSKYIARDDHDLEGLKAYKSAEAAFGIVVDNSVNGTRHGTVTAGQPRFEAPAQQPAAAH